MKRYVYTIYAKEYSENRMFRVVAPTVKEALDCSAIVYQKIRFKGVKLEILSISRGDEVYI